MKLFLVFNVITFCALFLTGLLTYGTAAISQVVVYGILWLGSFSIIVGTRVLKGKQSEWLRWEDDPGTGKASVLYWLAGVMVVFSLASLIPTFLVKTGFTAALYVPEPNSLAATLPISQAMLLDIFFNMTVVGFVEQMIIVAIINAVVSESSEAITKGVVAAMVIALISLAHGYLAYAGPLMWVGIITAFGAFLAMFIIQLKTGSLVLTGEVHSAYNTIRIILPILLAFIH